MIIKEYWISVPTDFDNLDGCERRFHRFREDIEEDPNYTIYRVEVKEES